MISDIFIESEYTRIVNNITHPNDKEVHVVYVIDSDSESDKGSNCNVEYSDLWWMMKRCSIFMRKNKRETS